MTFQELEEWYNSKIKQFKNMSKEQILENVHKICRIQDMHHFFSVNQDVLDKVSDIFVFDDIEHYYMKTDFNSIYDFLEYNAFESNEFELFANEEVE